jgi:predicted phage terminase large subunit-like protein
MNNAAEQLKNYSDKELEELLLAAKMLQAAQRAREDMIDYARFMSPDPNHPRNPDHTKYVVKSHHRLLADAVDRVFDGRIMNLAVSLPPQSGKSSLFTRFGLSWHIGRFPWKHLLMGSYNQTFAEEFGEDVRSLLNADEYKLVFPGVELRQGSKAKDHMVTTDGGKISFLGRGGSGTGRPADGWLIDDPLKDAKEAASLTIRDDAWNWFARVMNTRAHMLTWKIIVATRWSEDDIIGRLLDPTNPHYDAEIAKNWHYINVPSIMDDVEIAAALGLKVGDALWPERFPLELLEQARRLDPIGFSALHQGKPTPPEGAFFKQFMLKGYDEKELPRHGHYYLTGDLAVSPEQRADKSCIGLWLLDKDDVAWLLPDVFWERKSSDQTVEAIIERAKIYIIMEAFMEKGQLDRAIGPFLEKRLQEEEVYLPITRLPVSGDKRTKALAMRGRMAQGKVRLPTFAPWWSAAKDQILKFNGDDGREDDLVDMLSLFGQAFGSQIPGNAPREKPSNVVKIGTLRWIRQTSEAEKAARDRRVKLARL